MDYKNGKIYKIVSDLTDKIYIGSTTQPLSKRLCAHKSKCKKYLKGKQHLVTSFDIIKFGDAQIFLIENYPCNDKNELHARERFHIEQNKDIVVNKCIPSRTQKEYYRENRQKKLEYAKGYHENNLTKDNEYRKNYYEENKAKLIQQVMNNPNRYIKHHCECGGTYMAKHKSQHFKTTQHRVNLEEINKEKIRISREHFEILFKCDSTFKLPYSYTNFLIID